MSEVSPTRSAVLEMKDERRAMHEGHVFLDEKCLLLAGEILRQLEQHARGQREFVALHDDALARLQAAVARHGLQELQVYPPTELPQAPLDVATRSLMGVRLQQAQWSSHAASAADAVLPSPEAEACRQGFAAVLAAAAQLAAVSGNLERLSLEYRRSVRRARALQDVMLPELDHSIGDIEGRLEELEQEDAIWMRRGAGT
jgi:V/A-type H+/Na+-transporting ATPase subunit D